MHETIKLSLPTNTERIFNLMLLFYPKSYRKLYGQEMRTLFQDMYHEELGKNGRVGLKFWMHQIQDIFKSVIEQHMDAIRKKGMKKYLSQALNVNKYNVIGAIFLLPIVFMIVIEFISRVIQGDMFHYNRSFYHFISHSPLYWSPVLFTWVIIFPLIAIFINIIPLVKRSSKTKPSFFSFKFLEQNIVSILILFAAFTFLFLLKFHDFIPCMMQGIIRIGFGKIPYILSICQKA